MEKICKVRGEYLYLPVCAGREERKLEIFLKSEVEKTEKIFEFMVPMDGNAAGRYVCDFYAQIPVRQYQGREFLICGEFPLAFEEGIFVSGKRQTENQERPAVHFTADSGWTNDPNGLIYAEGIYHLYFQYNPFNTSWNNMSWGHAVSEDLLHWKQEDTVLFPDESGTMFSGCAIGNDRGMLGLSKEALLFFYTAAGGSNDWSRGREFTQKIAYSLDGGRTLCKMEEPCLPTVCRENRDPKVYWHEETQAYVMALWLEENDFGIFRSGDLAHWEQSDRFTLEGAWECPDLLCLRGEDGEICWFFWAADGFCFPGEFDGYHFRPAGSRQRAYVNSIPYAAQTYSGVTGRVISIPWLRMENDGRSFTGTYGIPVELGCKKTGEGYVLTQRPVRELQERLVRIGGGGAAPGGGSVVQEGGRIICRPGKGKALVLEMRALDGRSVYTWEINDSRVCYDPLSGLFAVDGEESRVGCGYRELTLIVDDRILEVFFEGGICLGTFLLQGREAGLAMPEAIAAEYTAYEV